MKKWRYWLIFILLIAAIISITIAISKTFSIDKIKATKPITTKTEKQIIKESNTTQLHKVIKVVDGDTIIIDYNGNEEKVRMIGVNTPESVDPRRPVQCFGIEASNYTKELLKNKSVKIKFDETQNIKDKYGRLLLYVYLNNDLLVNKEIIKNGYGYEYTYIHPYKYSNDFKAAEIYAKENKLGLWADGACIK